MSKRAASEVGVAAAPAVSSMAPPPPPHLGLRPASPSLVPPPPDHNSPAPGDSPLFGATRAQSAGPSVQKRARSAGGKKLAGEIADATRAAMTPGRRNAGISVELLDAISKVSQEKQCQFWVVVRRRVARIIQEENLLFPAKTPDTVLGRALAATRSADVAADVVVEWAKKFALTAQPPLALSPVEPAVGDHTKTEKRVGKRVMALSRGRLVFQPSSKDDRMGLSLDECGGRQEAGSGSLHTFLGGSGGGADVRPGDGFMWSDLVGVGPSDSSSAETFDVSNFPIEGASEELADLMDMALSPTADSYSLRMGNIGNTDEHARTESGVLYTYDREKLKFAKKGATSRSFAKGRPKGFGPFTTIVSTSTALAFGTTFPLNLFYYRHNNNKVWNTPHGPPIGRGEEQVWAIQKYYTVDWPLSVVRLRPTDARTRVAVVSYVAREAILAEIAVYTHGEVLGAVTIQPVIGVCRSQGMASDRPICRLALVILCEDGVHVHSLAEKGRHAEDAGFLTEWRAGGYFAGCRIFAGFFRALIIGAGGSLVATVTSVYPDDGPTGPLPATFELTFCGHSETTGPHAVASARCFTSRQVTTLRSDGSLVSVPVAKPHRVLKGEWQLGPQQVTMCVSGDTLFTSVNNDPPMIHRLGRDEPEPIGDPSTVHEMHSKAHAEPGLWITVKPGQGLGQAAIINPGSSTPMVVCHAAGDGTLKYYDCTVHY